MRLLLDLDLQLRFGTQWDPTNAVRLLKYIKSQGYGENVDFELGNGKQTHNCVNSDYLLNSDVRFDLQNQVVLSQKRSN